MTVPIIGQPAVLGFVPTVLLQCSCEGRHPMLSVGLGAIVECPGCHRRLQVRGLAWDAATGGLNIQIAPVTTAETPRP